VSNERGLLVGLLLRDLAIDGCITRRPAAGTALAAAGRPRHAELAVSSRRSITLACQPFRETGGMLSQQT